MPKEYRTVQEVAGPLMLVKEVEGVKYDELGEIELESGETRRCRVLEVNGTDALVQLFEASTGIKTPPPYSGSTVRLQGSKRASLSISFFTAVIPRSRSAMPDFGSAFMR